MIHDLALRWVVTLLFVFSAAVCVSAILSHRHAGESSKAGMVSHSLHAIMAVAMAVMAWPRGAELPTRAPMIFFAVAAVWFAVVMVRTSGHRVANSYHTLMMLAMAWMYAAMGGLPLRREPSAEPDMADMPGMSGHAGHAGHGAHGAGAHPGTETATWIGTLNWLCTIGFAVAAVYWLYRFITARLQSGDDDAHSSIGILCQLAMASGMAIMFAVML